MAFSKIILNGTTLMDATTATASAGDIVAPKTAMLADGEMTTGTGSLGYTIDDIATKDFVSGALVFNGRITRQYAFFGCTGITSVVINSSDSGAVTGVFQSCTNLVSATDNNTGEFGNDYFNGCTKLNTLIAPKLVHVSARSLRSTKIVRLVLPNCGFVWNTGCGSCTSLIAVDLGWQGDNSVFDVNAFNGATSMNVLVIRNKNFATTLNNISAFTNTPFASGKAGGTLYVPNALIADYQAATNWSTILGYATNSIQAIEGSIYETQYVDGTPIEET